MNLVGCDNNVGKLRSKVRHAVHRYLIDELTEERFKSEITEILHKFGKRLPKKILCQDIGLIVQEREQSIPNKPDKFKRIWLLLSQIEPDIEQALNEWQEAMSK